MLEGDKIKVAQGENPCYLLLDQANRHGLIAGASGTGKTVTMKVLAEGFAQAGVPVFMADVKGDVTGMAQPGDDTEKVRERAAALGAAGWEPRGCDVRLWDMLGGDGVPVRITISDMGPDLLARLLGLTDVQRGVLAIAFRMADDNGMLLIDLKDLRAMLGYLSEHASEVETLYGRVSSQSVGAIQRALLTLEDAGGDIFFGEPALDITDWLVTDDAGQGTVNILNAAKLMASPQVYAMFLLWMLSEIYELLPEAGDLPKPKLVFFFDEAHLLFDDMPKELTDKIVQTVKLIRSKGVGVYFVSQSPADIPDEVLAQLSNRIQHGLRAYTPAEQKAVRAAAAAFRENPAFDSAEALLELGTGEALVSLLAAIAVFLLIRESPEACGLAPYGTREEASSSEKQKLFIHPSRLRWAMLYLGVILIGLIASPGFAHMMILFTSSGFSGAQAVFSFMPGAIADLTGSYAPAYIVFTLFAIFTLAVVQSTYRLERRSAV